MFAVGQACAEHSACILIITQTLQGMSSYYPLFADKEMEAQRSEIICPPNFLTAHRGKARISYQKLLNTTHWTCLSFLPSPDLLVKAGGRFYIEARRRQADGVLAERPNPRPPSTVQLASLKTGLGGAGPYLGLQCVAWEGWDL